MAQEAQAPGVDQVGDGDATPLMRTMANPYCERLSCLGGFCWRTYCESCFGPLSRHASTREAAEAKARAWSIYHTCGISPYDRIENRRAERRRELASAAHEAGLLFWVH